VLFHQIGPKAPLLEVAPTAPGSMERSGAFSDEPAEGAAEGGQLGHLEEYVHVV